MEGKANLRIGIAGLGAIGRTLARRLDEGIPGCVLEAVCGHDAGRTAAFLKTLGHMPRTATFDELPEHCDIVIECAPSHLLGDIARPALRAGRQVVVLSVGALLDNPDLTELARVHGGQILVPTGALIGLDAVTAAAEGKIRSVRMVSRKPPRGLLNAPFLAENGIDLHNLSEPLKLYEGSARGAIKGFPANLNVAVALSLAGIGPDETHLEVWADPGVVRNTHHIEVASDAALFTMTMENIPSENPKTGRITAQSVLALLRKMSAPLRIGT